MVNSADLVLLEPQLPLREGPHWLRLEVLVLVLVLHVVRLLLPLQLLKQVVVLRARVVQDVLFLRPLLVLLHVADDILSHALQDRERHLLSLLL